MSSADAICKKAEGKTKGVFGFFADYDEACELYTKAACQYKLQGSFIQAGEAFMKAAECARKVKNDYRLSESYYEAALMFLKVGSSKASSAIDLAAQALVDGNRMSRAADLVWKAAEALKELGKTEEALARYQLACKYYRADGQSVKVMKCREVEADMLTDEKKYAESKKIYEDLGRESLSGPLKFQASNFFVKAMLCQFASIREANRLVDLENSKDVLADYVAMNPLIEGSREHEVLNMIQESLEEDSMDRFDEVVELMQTVKMLDSWNTPLMLVIKEKINSIM